MLTAMLAITFILPIVSPARAASDDDGCPPIICGNIAHPNLLSNPSFEVIGPNGPSVGWSGPLQGGYPQSAAANWYMHNDNFGCNVTTNLVRSNRPGGGSYMMHVVAGGSESGILQLLASNPNPIVASVWVYVVPGHVVLQTSAMSGGPFAKSTKTNQWELLQLYNNGSFGVDYFSIYNKDFNGGEFYAELACETLWLPDYAKAAPNLNLLPANTASKVPTTARG